MEVLSQILEILNAILSGWLMLMLVYQLVITFFGYKRNTKDYQDHAPLMRFLVLVPAHNEEAVIGDIVQNLNEMEYPREMYDFYILADNCTDRTAEIARGLGANVLESWKDSPDAPTGKPIVLQIETDSTEVQAKAVALLATYYKKQRPRCTRQGPREVRTGWEPPCR